MNELSFENEVFSSSPLPAPHVFGLLELGSGPAEDIAA